MALNKSDLNLAVSGRELLHFTPVLCFVPSSLRPTHTWAMSGFGAARQFPSLLPPRLSRVSLTWFERWHLRLKGYFCPRGRWMESLCDRLKPQRSAERHEKKVWLVSLSDNGLKWVPDISRERREKGAISDLVGDLSAPFLKFWLHFYPNIIIVTLALFAVN